jgi:cyclopropane fatty-acyl-phospholipid synthase-like methyltransferase
MDVQTNWWESFFEGVAVAMWVQALPAEHTAREADRLARLLDAAPGAEILDVPCGAGRLSLALAERGYRVTGVDWSSEFLAHARRLMPHGRSRGSGERCAICRGPDGSTACSASATASATLTMKETRRSCAP